MLCHLLFIDCHRLHCQGRQAPRGGLQRGRRREERSGLLRAGHPGLQGSAPWGWAHVAAHGRALTRCPLPRTDAPGWEAPGDGQRGGPAPPRRAGSCQTELGWLSLPPTGRCWDLGHPEVAAPPTEVPNPPGCALKPYSLGEEGGEGKEKGERGKTNAPFLGLPRWMVAGAAVGGRGRAAQLRARGQSRISPPATRGWPGRHGPRPHQVRRPWAQRRSACRRQTGSRREPTGPRWKAGGSGGGTHGRCSRDRPAGRGDTVRAASSHSRGGSSPSGRRASWTARGSSPWPLPGGAGRRGFC